MQQNSGIFLVAIQTLTKHIGNMLKYLNCRQNSEDNSHAWKCSTRFTIILCYHPHAAAAEMSLADANCNYRNLPNTTVIIIRDQHFNCTRFFSRMVSNWIILQQEDVKLGIIQSSRVMSICSPLWRQQQQTGSRPRLEVARIIVSYDSFQEQPILDF